MNTKTWRKHHLSWDYQIETLKEIEKKVIRQKLSQNTVKKHMNNTLQDFEGHKWYKSIAAGFGLQMPTSDFSGSRFSGVMGSEDL